MAEKRKPRAVIVAVVNGTRTKIELFLAGEFPLLRKLRPGDRGRGRWRLRVNGRWWPSVSATATVSGVCNRLRRELAYLLLRRR